MTTATKTIRVKKPADPFQSTINKAMAERQQRDAMGKVNDFRNSIGHEPWWKRVTRALGGGL
ncbi:hypothetical protein HRR99_03065 [Agrobacterium vaccinii]|uniref:hypothetical protein n=1 Tax=Agrobacterium vaccinii TaxID=2735528 RepID=UPI001E4A145C|nr:hypothetical protein [Agrobacterium vaccinii]UHS60572.1 hypothetical protein HRR99_03065 [Agrobacterium vaccinii]